MMYHVTLNILGAQTRSLEEEGEKIKEKGEQRRENRGTAEVIRTATPTYCACYAVPESLVRIQNSQNLTDMGRVFK